MKEQIYHAEWHINRMLFKLAAFVTFLAMAMMLASFFTRGAFPESKISVFYIGVLMVYSLHKEALRWLSEKGYIRGEKKGEYFIYVWIVVTSLLYLINFLTKNYFIVGDNGQRLTALSEITVTSLEIFAVFIFARIFKVVFNFLYYKRNNRG